MLISAGLTLILLSIAEIVNKISLALGYQTISNRTQSKNRNAIIVRQAIEEAYESEKAEEVLRDLKNISSKKTYKNGDPLRAIELSRDRLQEHILKLRNNSITNLFVSVLFAIFGIVILASAYLEIERYRDASSMSLNISEFVVIVLVPRISIALFVQIFSYFFLLMYRANLNDIKFFQNEITNLDCIAAGTSFSMRNNLQQSQKIVVNALIKTERNRLMNKNQKLIEATNDEKNIGKIIEINRQLSSILKGKIQDRD